MQENNPQNMPNVEEFIKFHELLTKDHPSYHPFYLPLMIGGKDPIKGKSWKMSSISFGEAKSQMRKGYNIGIAGTDTDKLCIVDVDDLNQVDINQLKPTLRIKSRKQIGLHNYYFTDDPITEKASESAKQNLATDDAGEVRAKWQYVVAPGSYVQCSDEEIERIPDEDKPYAGYYRILEENTVTDITFSELPEIYRNVAYEKIGKETADQLKAQKNFLPVAENDGNKSAIWSLDIHDVTGLNNNPGERFEMLSEFHGSETGKNASVSNDLLHCWRHSVSHNAFSYLAVASGFSTCAKAGCPHGGSTSGTDMSDPETCFKIWKYAKEKGFIPENDPIPTKALVYVALENKLCSKADIEDGWKLPLKAYNETIRKCVEDGLNPGRKEYTKAIKTERKELSIEEVCKLLEAIKPSANDMERLKQATDFATENLICLSKRDAEIVLNVTIKGYFALKNKELNIIEKAYKEARKNSDKSQQIQNKTTESLSLDDAMQAHLDHISTRNIIYHLFAEAYLQDHTVISLPGSIYEYRDGIYVSGPEVEVEVRKDILQLARDHEIYLDDSQIKGIMKLIMISTKKNMDDCEPDAQHVIVLNNGIFDLRDWELHDFDPEKVYFSKLPVNYNPDAPVPPMFMKYLYTTFAGTEDDAILLQEIAGYAMCRHYHYQFVFYLLGDGGNGKGVFLDLLVALLGRSNTSSFSLHDFTQGTVPYNVAGLHGKFANICGDVGYETVKTTDTLKKLSSGTDLVTGRHPYGRPFQFKSFAKMIYAMNRLPKKPSNTRGDKRRDMIVTFNNSIGNTEKDIIGLQDKIIEAGEMEGILNWAIDGLQRLYKNKGFTCTKTVAQRAIEYDKKSHPMRYFVEDCILEIEPGEFRYDSGVKTVDVYEAYEIYRKTEGLPEMDQEEIKWRMVEECKKVGIETSVKRENIKGSDNKRIGQKLIFHGIKLNPYIIDIKNEKIGLQKHL